MNKTEIAADFLSRHKESDADKWQPFGIFGDKKLEAIYDNLISDVCGTVHDDAEYDDDGEVVTPATEWWVEIPAHQSKSGHAEIFYFTMAEEEAGNGQ